MVTSIGNPPPVLRPAATPRRFVHSGKYGDVLYALPAIRALGGGLLYLVPCPGVGMTMTPAAAESIAPLLRLQPYIDDVRYADGHRPHCLNLNWARERWNGGLNIVDLYLDLYGLPQHHRDAAWLRVDEPRPVARVVFNRCPRYQNPRFPWRRAVAAYGRDAVFVGHPDEHAAFAAAFGRVPYYPTADYLALARVIAGAELFVGNQSSAHAVAEGLKKPVVQETSPECPDCRFDRPGFVAGRDEAVELPRVG